MKRRCKQCGMIRAEKDLVHLDSNTYLCFSCWNKKLKFKKQKNSQE
ncbi:MAG: hypothetical protein ACQERB_15970 [Promethearchaeati archaeon]